MIKFVLVEDNALYRKYTSNIIMTNMMKNKIEFDIVEFDDCSKKLFDFIENNSDDCVFILDLELPSGSGIDAARELRNMNNNWTCPIIILTAYTNEYYDVYKQRLQILDFIGKDEDVSKYLSENIDICLRMLNKDSSYRFTYKNIDYSVPLSKIDYIQRDGRRTKIVTKERDYYQNLSINIIKDSFPSYFVVSCKGIIINTKNIKKIDWTNCMVYFNDGISGYFVSKSHRKDIRDHDKI